MILVLLGLPGSGKGTQGEFLAKKLQLPYLCIGSVFRQLAEAGGEEGKLLDSYISVGRLVPSEVVNTIIGRYLMLPEYKDGYLLDGYPRSLEQAKFLEQVANNHPIKTIYFDLDEQIIYKRILGRFNCAECGKIYNSYYLPTKVENVCDVCKSKNFDYRHDDNEQTISKRISEYKAQTYPLVEYYKDKGGFYRIDASKSMQDIAIDIEVALKRI